MPAKRLSMRKIKEVLRLKHEMGLSARDIAKSCNIGRGTVSRYLERSRLVGVGWPLAEGLDEAELESLFFPPPPSPGSVPRPEPDWSEVYQELRRRRKVTLGLLWEEYKGRYREGYQYSWFCERYRQWAGRLNLSMRQEHKAGEKMFVDYAGQTVEVIQPLTGEAMSAQVFVAVLGASSYTYAEATWSQSLPDWIGSHQRAMSYFGGVPEIVVPDNLRVGVSKSCRYEPDLNPSYQDMASHYGMAVIPARVRKPRDKAKVEVGVQVVERWILAALRNRKFFSLEELNQAIKGLLVKLNDRPFKKMTGSRRSLFESLDKPALKPLPAEPYEYAEWKKARVHVDYHVELDRHYYSVPCQLVGRQLDIRFTQGTVECFHKGRRVASHHRCRRPGGYTTVGEHMPRSHQEQAGWTPERVINWARKVGLSTAEVAEGIMRRRSHPQQGFRACLGLMRLTRSFGEARLESACRRAVALGIFSYKRIQSILEHGLDKAALPLPASDVSPVIHPNIRGAAYFQGGERVD